MKTLIEAIRPQDKHSVFKKRQRELISEFKTTNPTMENVSCPFCDFNQPIHAFDLEGYSYTKCNNCESIYNTPRVSSYDLARYYSFISDKCEFTAPEDQRENRINLIMRPRWEALKYRLERQGVTFPVQRILEVGPGVGSFTQVLQEDNCAEEYILVEPDANSVEILKNLSNVKIINGMIEDAITTEHGDCDLIFINSVIEHPHTLVPFFSTLAKLLKQNGYIALVDMHAGGLDIEVLKGHAPNMGPLNILQVGSTQGVKTICKRCGLDVREIFPMGKMDADILFEASLNADPQNPLSGFARILAHPEVRNDLQDILRKHLLTGYLGYLITTENQS